MGVLKVPFPKTKDGFASEWAKETACESLSFIAREPIFQFIVLGLLLWGGSECWNAHKNRYTITVGPAERQRIVMTYVQQFGQMPTPDQVHRLIDGYIRDEIFFREGIALHLDKNDEIVRRRIVQKYAFLQEDVALPESPALGVLENWFEHHKLRYAISERVGFTHVYFSSDVNGEQAAKTRALRVLAQLQRTNAVRAPGLGDSFPGPIDVSAVGPEDADRLFGHSDLSNQLFKVPVAKWSGPFQSGYGWHLIYVNARIPSMIPELRKVKEQVLRDYLDEQQGILNVHSFETLRAKYTVHDEGGSR